MIGVGPEVERRKDKRRDVIKALFLINPCADSREVAADSFGKLNLATETSVGGKACTTRSEVYAMGEDQSVRRWVGTAGNPPKPPRRARGLLSWPGLGLSF